MCWAPGQLPPRSSHSHVISRRFVDVVFPGVGPFRAFAETLSVDGYQKAHDILLGRTFRWQYLVGGHLNILNRHDVDISKNFVDDVEVSVLL